MTRSDTSHAVTMQKNEASARMSAAQDRCSSLDEWMDFFYRLRVIDLEGGWVRLEFIARHKRGSRR